MNGFGKESLDIKSTEFEELFENHDIKELGVNKITEGAGALGREKLREWLIGLLVMVAVVFVIAVVNLIYLCCQSHKKTAIREGAETLTVDAPAQEATPDQIEAMKQELEIEFNCFENCEDRMAKLEFAITTFFSDTQNVEMQSEKITSLLDELATIRQTSANWKMDENSLKEVQNRVAQKLQTLNGLEEVQLNDFSQAYEAFRMSVGALHNHLQRVGVMLNEGNEHNFTHKKYAQCLADQESECAKLFITILKKVEPGGTLGRINGIFNDKIIKIQSNKSKIRHDVKIPQAERQLLESRDKLRQLNFNIRTAGVRARVVQDEINRGLAAIEKQKTEKKIDELTSALATLNDCKNNMEALKTAVITCKEDLQDLKTQNSNVVSLMTNLIKLSEKFNVYDENALKNVLADLEKESQSLNVLESAKLDAQKFSDLLNAHERFEASAAAMDKCLVDAKIIGSDSEYGDLNLDKYKGSQNSQLDALVSQFADNADAIANIHGIINNGTIDISLSETINMSRVEGETCQEVNIQDILSNWQPESSQLNVKIELAKNQIADLRKNINQKLVDLEKARKEEREGKIKELNVKLPELEEKYKVLELKIKTEDLVSNIDKLSFEVVGVGQSGMAEVNLEESNIAQSKEALQGVLEALNKQYISKCNEISEIGKKCNKICSTAKSMEEELRKLTAELERTASDKFLRALGNEDLLRRRTELLQKEQSLYKAIDVGGNVYGFTQKVSDSESCIAKQFEGSICSIIEFISKKIVDDDLLESIDARKKSREDINASLSASQKLKNEINEAIKKITTCANDIELTDDEDEKLQNIKNLKSDAAAKLKELNDKLLEIQSKLEEHKTAVNSLELANKHDFIMMCIKEITSIFKEISHEYLVQRSLGDALKAIKKCLSEEEKFPEQMFHPLFPQEDIKQMKKDLQTATNLINDKIDKAKQAAIKARQKDIGDKNLKKPEPEINEADVKASEVSKIQPEKDKKDKTSYEEQKKDIPAPKYKVDLDIKPPVVEKPGMKKEEIPFEADTQGKTSPTEEKKTEEGKNENVNAEQIEVFKARLKELEQNVENFESTVSSSDLASKSEQLKNQLAEIGVSKFHENIDDLNAVDGLLAQAKANFEQANEGIDEVKAKYDTEVVASIKEKKNELAQYITELNEISESGVRGDIDGFEEHANEWRKKFKSIGEALNIDINISQSVATKKEDVKAKYKESVAGIIGSVNKEASNVLKAIEGQTKAQEFIKKAKKSAQISQESINNLITVISEKGKDLDAFTEFMSATEKFDFSDSQLANLEMLINAVEKNIQELNENQKNIEQMLVEHKEAVDGLKLGERKNLAVACKEKIEKFISADENLSADASQTNALGEVITKIEKFLIGVKELNQPAVSADEIKEMKEIFQQEIDKTTEAINIKQKEFDKEFEWPKYKKDLELNPPKASKPKVVGKTPPFEGEIHDDVKAKIEELWAQREVLEKQLIYFEQSENDTNLDAKWKLSDIKNKISDLEAKLKAKLNVPSYEANLNQMAPKVSKPMVKMIEKERKIPLTDINFSIDVPDVAEYEASKKIEAEKDEKDETGTFDEILAKHIEILKNKKQELENIKLNINNFVEISNYNEVYKTKFEEIKNLKTNLQNSYDEINGTLSNTVCETADNFNDETFDEKLKFVNDCKPLFESAYSAWQKEEIKAKNLILSADEKNKELASDIERVENLIKISKDFKEIEKNINAIVENTLNTESIKSLPISNVKHGEFKNLSLEITGILNTTREQLSTKIKDQSTNDVFEMLDEYKTNVQYINECKENLEEHSKKIQQINEEVQAMLVLKNLYDVCQDFEDKFDVKLGANLIEFDAATAQKNANFLLNCETYDAILDSIIDISIANVERYKVALSEHRLSKKVEVCLAKIDEKLKNTICGYSIQQNKFVEHAKKISALCGANIFIHKMNTSVYDENSMYFQELSWYYGDIKVARNSASMSELVPLDNDDDIVKLRMSGAVSKPKNGIVQNYTWSILSDDASIFNFVERSKLEQQGAFDPNLLTVHQSTSDKDVYLIHSKKTEHWSTVRVHDGRIYIFDSALGLNNEELFRFFKDDLLSNPENLDKIKIFPTPQQIGNNCGVLATVNAAASKDLVEKWQSCLSFSLSSCHTKFAIEAFKISAEISQLFGVHNNEISSFLSNLDTNDINGIQKYSNVFDSTEYKALRKKYNKLVTEARDEMREKLREITEINERDGKKFENINLFMQDKCLRQGSVISNRWMPANTFFEDAIIAKLNDIFHNNVALLSSHDDLYGARFKQAIEICQDPNSTEWQKNAQRFVASVIYQEQRCYLNDCKSVLEILEKFSNNLFKGSQDQFSKIYIACNSEMKKLKTDLSNKRSQLEFVAERVPGSVSTFEIDYEQFDLKKFQDNELDIFDIQYLKSTGVTVEKSLAESFDKHLNDCLDYFMFVGEMRQHLEQINSLSGGQSKDKLMGAFCRRISRSGLEPNVEFLSKFMNELENNFVEFNKNVESSLEFFEAKYTELLSSIAGSDYYGNDIVNFKALAISKAFNCGVLASKVKSFIEFIKKNQVKLGSCHELKTLSDENKLNELQAFAERLRSIQAKFVEISVDYCDLKEFEDSIRTSLINKHKGITESPVNEDELNTELSAAKNILKKRMNLFGRIEQANESMPARTAAGESYNTEVKTIIENFILVYRDEAIEQYNKDDTIPEDMKYEPLAPNKGLKEEKADLAKGIEKLLGLPNMLPCGSAPKMSNGFVNNINFNLNEYKKAKEQNADLGELCQDDSEFEAIILQRVIQKRDEEAKIYADAVASNLDKRLQFYIDVNALNQLVNSRFGEAQFDEKCKNSLGAFWGKILPESTTTENETSVEAKIENLAGYLNSNLYTNLANRLSECKEILQTCYSGIMNLEDEVELSVARRAISMSSFECARYESIAKSFLNFVNKNADKIGKNAMLRNLLSKKVCQKFEKIINEFHELGESFMSKSKIKTWHDSEEYKYWAAKKEIAKLNDAGWWDSSASEDWSSEYWNKGETPKQLTYLEKMMKKISDAYSAFNINIETFDQKYFEKPLMQKIANGFVILNNVAEANKVFSKCDRRASQIIAQLKIERELAKRANDTKKVQKLNMEQNYLVDLMRNYENKLNSMKKLRAFQDANRNLTSYIKTIAEYSTTPKDSFAIRRERFYGKGPDFNKLSIVLQEGEKFAYRNIDEEVRAYKDEFEKYFNWRLYFLIDMRKLSDIRPNIDTSLSNDFELFLQKFFGDNCENEQIKKNLVGYFENLINEAIVQAIGVQDRMSKMHEDFVENVKRCKTVNKLLALGTVHSKNQGKMSQLLLECCKLRCKLEVLIEGLNQLVLEEFEKYYSFDLKTIEELGYADLNLDKTLTILGDNVKGLKEYENDIRKLVAPGEFFAIDLVKSKVQEINNPEAKSQQINSGKEIQKLDNSETKSQQINSGKKIQELDNSEAKSQQINSGKEIQELDNSEVKSQQINSNKKTKSSKLHSYFSIRMKERSSSPKQQTRSQNRMQIRNQGFEISLNSATNKKITPAIQPFAKLETPKIEKRNRSAT